MFSKQPSRIRILSVVAATVIALACGTNYVYSAWAPQFAQRLQLTATQSNLIGTFGNLGMYFSGVPFGMMIDAKGPKWGVALSIVLFAAGYYPLAKAFDAGPGVFPVAVLCLFSFSTGAGSYAGYGAAIKAVAVNFPGARGTATAFPTAAFGLSASAFATTALAFPHDTPHFLLLLAGGTVVLPLVSFPFLRTVPRQDYKTLPQHDVSTLRRSSLIPSSQILGHPDAGAQDPNTRQAHPPRRHSSELEDRENDETASLFSNSSSEAVAELEAMKSIEEDKKTEHSDVDIRGFALARHTEFWQLFPILALLAGAGLMTINNIGNDVQALWHHYDPEVEDAFIAKRQVAHVSTLSLCSFAGRLISGVISDVLVNRYRRSRLWCILVSAILFSIAQLLGVFIELPDLLVLMVGITGIAYGILFGVYPSVVAQAFGVNGFSQNWGTMCMAPAISGNVFNIMYGRIFDGHSIIRDDGTRQCLQGRECYSKAYLATWTSSLAAIVLCCWGIIHENRVTVRRQEHERSA